MTAFIQRSVTRMHNVGSFMYGPFVCDPGNAEALKVILATIES
jgi:hypothetical protein